MLRMVFEVTMVLAVVSAVLFILRVSRKEEPLVDNADEHESGL